MATQQNQAVSVLRELILSGTLAAGARVTEIALAARLGLSRTPVRHALAVVARQGLLNRCGQRGYMVGGFSTGDRQGGFDVRGILEGVAARSLAEQGISAQLREALGRCLAGADQALHRGDEAAFLVMDLDFHALIVQAAGNQAVAHLLAQNSLLSLVEAWPVTGLAALQHAQRQHHAIVSALDEGDGVRAEALMREHMQISRQCLVWQPAR